VEHLGDRDEAHRLLKASFQEKNLPAIPLPAKKLFDKPAAGMS